MPRKNLIDEENIRWEKIDLEIIEKKNCLGVNLVFNTPLGQRQCHTMRTFFRIDVDQSGQTAKRKIKNSWKGLIMLLLSLIYCKYGKKTLLTLLDGNYSASRKYTLHNTYSYDFDVFLSEDKKREYEQSAMIFLSPDEIILSIVPSESRKSPHKKEYPKESKLSPEIWKEYQEEVKRRQEVWDAFFEDLNHRKLANRKAFLMGLPADPTFEQIVVPPSWKACYVKGKYTPLTMEKCIMIYAKLLDLNIKKSIIVTENNDGTPYQYTINPAKYQDKSGLLCSCPSEFAFTYGIEIVEYEAFLSKLATKYVQVIDPKIPPNEIKNGRVPIYGYNVSDSTVKQLCKYFPFMEAEFYNVLTTMGGKAWVIFDSKYLGKWG